MKTTFATILVTLSAGMAANAACSHGGSGSVWNFRVYTSTGCSGLHHYEYFGSHSDICQCFNINSPLNDAVKSFVYTSGKKTLSIYKDAGCGGTLLGKSTGDWIKDPVSSAGQAASSFRIC